MLVSFSKTMSGGFSPTAESRPALPCSPRCAAMALNVSNWCRVLSAAALAQPASLKACAICSGVPISIRLVTSLGLEGFSAKV